MLKNAVVLHVDAWSVVPCRVRGWADLPVGPCLHNVHLKFPCCGFLFF